MADALVLGASTFCVWVQVPSSAPIKSTPAGVLFIGAEDGGERIPFRKGAVCALIEREGGTAKVPPSHIPFLAVVSGGAVSGFWAEDGEERIPFCKGAVCALIKRERQP